MNKTKTTSNKNRPCMVELQANKKYQWCACGQSKQQPFCDGSHQGTGQTPIELLFDENTYISLCGCKLTARPPYCDGSHNQLNEHD